MSGIGPRSPDPVVDWCGFTTHSLPWGGAHFIPEVHPWSSSKTNWIIFHLQLAGFSLPFLISILRCGRLGMSAASAASVCQVFQASHPWLSERSQPQRPGDARHRGEPLWLEAWTTKITDLYGTLAVCYQTCPMYRWSIIQLTHRNWWFSIFMLK